MHQLSSAPALYAWHYLRCYPTPFPLLLVDLLPVQQVSVDFAGSSRPMDLSERLSLRDTGLFPVELGVSRANSTGLAVWGRVTGWEVKYPVIILLQGRAVSRRCETCRWDGAAFISGHVWWLEVQDGPSLDMANTTWGPVWVLSPAWMHKESLSLLESIQSAVMEFVSLLSYLWKTPNNAFPPVCNVVKRKGKLRTEEYHQDSGVVLVPPALCHLFLAHAFMGTWERQRSPLHQVPVMGWYGWIWFLSTAATCAVAMCN